MKIFFSIIGIVIVLFVIVYTIGLLMPEKHVGKRTVEFNQSAEVVWELITNHANETLWRKDLKNIERLPDRNENEVWKETSEDDQEMILETIESVSNTKLVRKIVDNQFFGGTWIIEITKTETGCRVLFTENGEIYNPIFRFMFNLFVSETATIDQYIKMIAQHFNEKVELR
jgi:hypothetical protein